MMMKNYDLEWFDTIVSVILNPDKSDLTSIGENQIKDILSKLQTEVDGLKKSLKKSVFNLDKEQQIKLLIGKYHSTLIVLLHEVCENRNKISKDKVLLKNLLRSVAGNISELLFFIEVRFYRYLSLDTMIPKTYVRLATKSMVGVNKLKARMCQETEDHELINLIFSDLCRQDSSDSEVYFTSLGEILYRKALLKELENLIIRDKKTSNYSPLIELLIYYNFNSTAFMNYFTQMVAQKLNGYDNLTSKLDWLLIQYKELKQIHKKQDAVFKAQNRDVQDILSNWFLHEIFYLEKKMHLSIKPLKGEMENSKSHSMILPQKQKVLCILSSDQTGLIIRADDELRILVAKSMSEVFKTIVPHLSTPYKEDLSYDGMRSKSYVAEERDKQIAIETLERIIKKIKEY